MTQVRYDDMTLEERAVQDRPVGTKAWMVEGRDEPDRSEGVPKWEDPEPFRRVFLDKTDATEFMDSMELGCDGLKVTMVLWETVSGKGVWVPTLK